MSYKRKQQEKKRYQKLYNSNGHGYPQPIWWDSKKGCWVRLWKSDGKTSCYAWAKKYSRKKARCRAKRTNTYTKKVADPMYIAW